MTAYVCTKCLEEKDESLFYPYPLSTIKKVSSRCKECLKAIQRARNKTKVYSEKDKERARRWAEANKEKVVLQSRARRLRNIESHRASVRNWELNNPERKALRRRGMKIASPSWSQPERMKEVYKKARQFGFQVDHIVPLIHPMVCGLHCWDNLQLLDKSLNSSKSNRYWPDMPVALSASELMAVTA